MKSVNILFGAASIVIAAGLSAQETTRPLNELTEAEKEAGWTLLFDGESTEHWRGYQRDAFPESGWMVEGGALEVVEGGGGGDIITKEQYADFELALEFRVSPKANSGIMFRVTEKFPASWQTGPEFQILDDRGHDLEPTNMHSVGALYDLYPPNENKLVKPAGQWNKARIRIENGQLQHHLNGELILKVDMTSQDWRDRIANSKFRVYEGFGAQPKGHIALQDHGNEVSFRNIRILDLSKPASDEVGLLDHGLDGWTWYCESGTPTDEVWSIEDGILMCAGKPTGYLRTNEKYDNYVLKLEWRWDPETKQAGNSGVLLRQHGEDKVWPACIEAQLHSGNAGDFINIGDDPIEADAGRTTGRRVAAMSKAERPVGKWNEYTIMVEGDAIRLFVNGQFVNELKNATERAGFIALQSEGAPIHFRNIRIAPID